MTSIKRSSAVPLVLVPALSAVVGCNSGPQVIAGVDPCLPQVYQQAACQYSVMHQGYWYNGMWYHHIYSSPALFYYNGYNGYVRSGGVVHSISPSSYAPSAGVPAGGRTTVVRGGFGGVGTAHATAGS